MPKKQTGAIPVLNLKTNEVEYASEQDIPKLIRAKTHTLQRGSELKVKNPFGEPGTIPAEEAAKAFDEGFTMDTQDERRERRLEKEFGERPGAALATGIASGLSFGLSDQALVKSGTFTAEELRALKEKNKAADLAGEITGAIAPIVVTGGGALAVRGAGAAARGAGAAVKGVAKAGAATEALTAKALKKAIAETGEKAFAKKVITSTLPKVAGSAVEGAFYGAGELIREDAIGNAELNAENMMHHAGLGALVGGSLGGVLGSMQATAPVIRKGIGGKAEVVKDTLKSKVGNVVDKGEAVTKFLKLTPTQSAKLSKAPGASLEDIGDFLVQKGQLKPFTTSKSLFKNLENLKESAGQRIGSIVKQADDLNKASNAPVHLSRKGIGQKIIDDLDANYIDKFGPTPGFKSQLAPIKSLRKEWEKFRDKSGSMSFDELHKLRMKTDSLIKYEKDPMKLTMKEDALRGVRTTLSESFKDAVGQVGAATKGSGQDILERLLEANKDFSMSSRVLPFMEKKVNKELNKSFLTLSDIILGAGVGSELGLGIGGEAALALGAAKKFIESDFKNKMVILATAERQKNQTVKTIRDSLDAYFSGSKRKGKRVIAPLAVLSTSFEKDAKPKKGETRRESVNRISKELTKLAANPERVTNSFNMRTMRIREAAPQLTDALHRKTLSAVDFLVEKMPKSHAATTSLQPQFDEYDPSAQELDEFEKYLEATLHPMTVVQDLSEGKISREGIEAIKRVYPELYDQIQEEMLEKIGNSDKKLSYQKRLEIGTILDIPTDPSLLPENIHGLQLQFDPGTRNMGAGVNSMGVINPTTTGMTNIDAAKRAQGGTESVIKRRSE